MTRDVLVSSQPSAIQAIDATMNIMKLATVTRAFTLAATRAAARTVVAAAKVLRIESSSSLDRVSTAPSAHSEGLSRSRRPALTVVSSCPGPGNKEKRPPRSETAVLFKDYASSTLCSIASGILATDIRVRAIWFSNMSAFSSSASDLANRATTALCRNCCARFLAVV